MTNTIKAAVLTVSDRAFQGIYEDESGPALREFVLKKGWRVAVEAIVPDEMPAIAAKLLRWCDEEEMDLILI